VYFPSGKLSETEPIFRWRAVLYFQQFSTGAISVSTEGNRFLFRKFTERKICTPLLNFMWYYLYLLHFPWIEQCDYERGLWVIGKALVGNITHIYLSAKVPSPHHM
jgi:hypothetical protein